MIIGRRDFLLAAGSGGSMMAVLQENPLQPEALDFERSRIVWKTKTGTSGYWRVAAGIRRPGSDDYTVLAATVMAGHIFQEIVSQSCLLIRSS